MSKSDIEWTEQTWNPTTGCDKISQGCKHCYAEVMSKRLKAMGMKKYSNGFELSIHEDTLDIPYHWRKPTTVFVNSMSDLFHKDVPLEYIQKVFKVMNDLPRHTFQVLTKRSDIVKKYSNQLKWTPNIWMGVSVENNDVVNRIDDLRLTGAMIKFLSIEPLLGSINNLNLDYIDWVIVGGESGPGARPMQEEWVIDIKNQCIDQEVAFFFKQWGGVHKKVAGRLLEGKTWDEMPKMKSFSKVS